MPRTKKTKAIGRARKEVDDIESVDDAVYEALEKEIKTIKPTAGIKIVKGSKESAKERLEAAEKDLSADRINVTNFKFMQLLKYNDFCKAIEYLFLLREIYGVCGFLRNITGYSQNLDVAWKEVESTELITLFGGRKKGFISDWLTSEMYDKLVRCDEVTFARFLSFFDISANFRMEMLTGSAHTIYLNSTANEKILNWLGERK